MEHVKTNRELGFGEPTVGYIWHAGFTPPWQPLGRWVVRRDYSNWIVLFRMADGLDSVVGTFPPTTEGERQAKTLALTLVRNAWE